MIKLLEFFGGIGSPRYSFEKIGIPVKSIDYVEVLNYAVNAYNGMFNNNYGVQDIKVWNRNIDLLVHGSPCQDWSKNGKNDLSTGRSLLYNRTLEILEKELVPRPKIVIWENVSNLLSKRYFEYFEHYLLYMEKLGYQNKYEILNASNYGISQNRERVFCVSILGENNFVFPKPRKMRNIREFIDLGADFEKYSLSENEKQLFFYAKSKNINNGKRQLYIKVNSSKRFQKVKDFDIINVERPTSKTRRGRIKQDVQMAQTLTTSGNQVVYYNGKLRKLTPREFWRLMGFSDKVFDKILKLGIPENVLYQLAGNSIVVDVLEAIYIELFKQGYLTYDGLDDLLCI